MAEILGRTIPDGFDVKVLWNGFEVCAPDCTYSHHGFHSYECFFIRKIDGDKKDDLMEQSVKDALKTADEAMRHYHDCLSKGERPYFYDAQHNLVVDIGAEHLIALAREVRRLNGLLKKNSIC